MKGKKCKHGQDCGSAHTARAGPQQIGVVLAPGVFSAARLELRRRAQTPPDDCAEGHRICKVERVLTLAAAGIAFAPHTAPTALHEAGDGSVGTAADLMQLGGVRAVRCLECTGRRRRMTAPKLVALCNRCVVAAEALVCTFEGHVQIATDGPCACGRATLVQWTSVCCLWIMTLR